MKNNYFKNLINVTFEEHAIVLKQTLKVLSSNIEKSSDIIAKSLQRGGTIFWCGNGGSAADSQHIAAEFVGRFKKDRKPLRSIALTTDSSILTCISNDYSFEEIFSRQLNALGRKGDVLVVITTSGKSENIKKVLIQAKKMKIKTIALLGKKGGICKNYADIPLIVSSNITARIQETHILIEHLLCELVEKKLGLD
jgi:D-sedoheptulose 7-phosphate isomerase